MVFSPQTTGAPSLPSFIALKRHIYHGAPVESMRNALEKFFTPDLRLRIRGERVSPDTLADRAMVKRFERDASMRLNTVAALDSDSFRLWCAKHGVCVETIDGAPVGTGGW